MDEPRTLVTGIVLGESPRWHDGRLWLADWGAGEVLSVGLDGHREVELEVCSFPFCFDWLPDGRLLVVCSSDRRLLRRESDGALRTHAEVGHLSDRPWNEVVVDVEGRAFVNGIGFDLVGGEPPRPGLVAVVEPDGTARTVADDLAFPNGMALTPDGRTLIVAESYAGRLVAFDVGAGGTLSNRRTWAQVDGSAPDGICLDADGAVWFGDVPNRRCVRVAEGGDVLEVIDLDRGCFSCALGGPDGSTLFLVAADWRGPDSLASRERTGVVLAVDAPAPRAGRP